MTYIEELEALSQEVAQIISAHLTKNGIAMEWWNKNRLIIQNHQRGTHPIKVDDVIVYKSGEDYIAKFPDGEEYTFYCSWHMRQDKQT